MTVVAPAFVSESEYLAWEVQQPVRHEYVDGQIFAMTGSTLRHSGIALELGARLQATLRGSPCRVTLVDMKLRVATNNAIYYPDVMVLCGALDPKAIVVDSPKFIAEILSPSTEHIDRREKLAAYRKIPALEEYLILAQDSIAAELYRRTGDTWQIFRHATGDQLELRSVDLTIALDELYASG